MRRVLLILALLLLAAYAALPALSGLPMLREWIGARLDRSTPWQIRFATMRIAHDLSLTLSALSVAQPGRAAPFLTADRIDVAASPLDLFSGQGLRVRIESPHLHMTELPAATGAPSSGLPPGLLERADVVDAYVHVPAGQGSTALGPFSAAIDAVVGAPDRLALKGTGVLPGDAGSVDWSAELGATLAQSHGELQVVSAAPLAALSAWIEAPLPDAVTPHDATAQLVWRGTETNRIAFDLEAAWQMPSSDAGIALSGNGEVNPADGQTRVTLRGKSLGFHSADGTRAASGVETRIELSASRSADGLRAELDLAVPAGEVLWDRFYVDLKQHRVTLRGRVQLAPGRVSLERGTLAIGGIGSIGGSGSYDVPRRREQWRAELDLPGLAAAYALGVREPLQADYPVLGRVELRGRAAGVVELRRSSSGARHIGGFIDLVDVRATTREPDVELDGLAIHLPLDLSDGGPASAESERGQIRVRHLSVGAAAIGAVALPLRVETNRIALAEPVNIAMLGGALELNEVDATQLMSAQPQARLGLAVRDLDLAEVARAAGWPHLSGRMVGEIPALTVDQHAVSSEGEIRLDVFEGRVRMRNLRVDEPLSPVPTLHLDLDIDDVSLAEMTNTFEIGRISGVAAGGVRGLEIANGQPARFDAWMGTVERSGVPQRISVTAIRQLSILGGAGGDPISFGVLGFFDEYRYAKMGFRCELENDRFVLRGVEERDGAQYLVVGTTLPPRVNVISHTRVISFSELVRRLSRVLALSETGQPASDQAPADEQPAAP